MINSAGDCRMDNDRPHIDLDSIPNFRRVELAKGAIALAAEVFSTPGAEERYQSWLKERTEKR